MDVFKCKVNELIIYQALPVKIFFDSLFGEIFR